MKLVLTLLLLAIVTTVVAQDTNEDGRVVRIPFRIAKKIQVELVGKDSCMDMLSVANEEIYILDKNIQFKDRVIDTLKKDKTSLLSQLENERNLKLTYKGLAEDCKKEYGMLKNKSDSYRRFTKVIGFLGTAVVTGLTAVILFVK